MHSCQQGSGKFANRAELHTHLTEQIIISTRHHYVQEKLLELGDSLSILDTALDIPRSQ